LAVANIAGDGLGGQSSAERNCSVWIPGIGDRIVSRILAGLDITSTSQVAILRGASDSRPVAIIDSLRQQSGRDHVESRHGQAIAVRAGIAHRSEPGATQALFDKNIPLLHP